MNTLKQRERHGMIYTIKHVQSDDCGMFTLDPDTTEQPYLVIDAATENRGGYITIEFETDDEPFRIEARGDLNICDVAYILPFILAEQTRQDVDDIASIFGEDYDQVLTFEV